MPWSTRLRYQVSLRNWGDAFFMENAQLLYLFAESSIMTISIQTSTMEKLCVRLLFVCQLFAACTQGGIFASKKSEPFSLTQAFDSLQVDSANCWLEIEKSAYVLRVKADTLTIREYPVVFGLNSLTDKRQEGDRGTPEGSFRIRDHYPHAKWRYFLWIDYPTADSWRKHEEAKAAGTIPPQAQIGGEIGIHGVPDGFDYLIPRRQNWTLGCISMNNADLTELYPYVYKGMRVVILP